uniref:HEAT repeat-containing protein 5B n=1 Tax=Aceria tosichella TaxID=561515 RepID=A0A6G1S8N9_9ACAR
MDGHQPPPPPAATAGQAQLKKPTILNLLKHKHKNDQQQAPTVVPEPPQQTINVDQLAREKVEEVEAALNGLSSLKQGVLNSWFSILKQIITAADLHRTNDGRGNDDTEQSGKRETGDCIYADYSDDNEQFSASVDLSEQFATNSVKWTIRVQAFKIVHRLVNLLSSSNSNNHGGAIKLPSAALVKLLPDLVRLAFVAATSPYDELKMQGFEMFKFLIENFATMEEKEFPGHSILEQYKTQVLSAVKPAFNLDAPPYTTAIASQICSLWICHGLEKEFSDVKRTYQLMLLSIEKLNGQGVNQHSKLYTESELEQERVDILGSWAQLTIASIENSTPAEQHCRLFRLTDKESANLRSLIEPQIDSLVDKWWEALKDYALLIMPSPKFIGILHDNENVYTREVALKLFEPVWPKLVLAQTYRLTLRHNDQPDQSADSKFVQFLCGIILRELSRFVISCKQHSKHNSQAPNSTILALRSLHLLLSNPRTQSTFQDSLAIAREFYLVLYDMAVNHVSELSVRFLLKVTLDKLFTLTFNKISNEESCVHYAIAKLISLLINTMKDIESTQCNKESQAGLDSLRLHLVLRITNLVSIVKRSPESILNEVPLQEELITVFQEMLRFDHDKSVSLSLIDQLHHLYPVMTESHRAHMIAKLYPELKSRIVKLAKSVQDMKSDDLDKSKFVQLEKFFEAFREMMRSSNSANRIELINSYVGLCNTAIDDLAHTKDQLVGDKSKREQVNYFTNQVLVIKKAFPEEFKGELLCKELMQQFSVHTKLQKQVEDELAPKSEKLLDGSTKGPNSKSGPTTRPRTAKITLKADFSNFYATKKS